MRQKSGIHKSRGGEALVETKIRVMLLQATGHLEALETGRSRKTFPPELLEECHPANTLVTGFLLPKCLLFFSIGMYLLYSVVLVSAVQQNELGMCIHISLPSWTFPTLTPLGHHRALS